MSSPHFQNKDPLTHVHEKRAEGALAFIESHGTEMPGSFSAGVDALKETGIIFLFFWILLHALSLPWETVLLTIGIFSVGWLIWKTGRVALLAWSRLERLHRLIEQERFEIEHHRPQEREELVVLYKEKGFEGKLLDDVVDVLMADQDRLLRVMLEEEMGLALEAHEHPLQEALGAAIGVCVATALAFPLLLFFDGYGMLIATLLAMGGAAILKARMERNRVIAAIVWTLAIGTLAFGATFLLARILLQNLSH